MSTKQAHQQFALSSQQVRQLMRRHKQTISGMAKAFALTQKRVREVREQGVCGFIAEEWHFLITGSWPTSTPNVAR